MTKFSEGLPPFRYLGVPLTSKKISIHQCLILVDKLVSRIRHWSVRLLNFAGRIQLINVLFAVTNFWMQCIPLPKRVIHNIEAIFRSFLWTGGETICRKSPIAWHNVCTPRNQGGQNIISINEWNQAYMINLLWNLSGKRVSLWIKWVHTYYVKNDDIWNVRIRNSCS